MDLAGLANTVRSIRAPSVSELNGFSAEQREALRPLVEAVERLVQALSEVDSRGDGGADTALSERVASLEVLARRRGSDEERATVARVFPERSIFRVKVTEEGGAAGDENGNCGYTYTVTSLEGVTLGTGLTPEKPRYEKCAYEQPGANSPGLGYWHTDNTFKLYEALEEIPDTTVCP